MKATKPFGSMIVGIDPSTDLTALLSMGVRQFYFGYLPLDYDALYSSQTSLNRRYRSKEQFSHAEEAQEMIKLLHSHDATVYLALNAFTSNAIMKPYIEQIYALFSNEVDAIIAANVSTAEFLKAKNYRRIVLSNLFGLYSVEAVAFFKAQYKPYKYILPRDITLDSIANIATSYPDEKFECFLFGDNCRFSEAFCFTEHGYDSVGFGSLCTYALLNRQPKMAPTPAFKQIVKSGKMSISEKKEALSVSALDLHTLMDTIESCLYAFDSKKISQTLQTLLRYDIAYLSENKQIFVRLHSLAQRLLDKGFDAASELYEKLSSCETEEVDYHAVFHKLNPEAIKKTMAFFERFDNIVSYKLPSRGRALYLLLEKLEASVEAYDYRRSQYQL